MRQKYAGQGPVIFVHKSSSSSGSGCPETSPFESELPIFQRVITQRMGILSSVDKRPLIENTQ